MPRTGPVSMRDLGVLPVAIGGASVIQPSWLDVRPIADAACAACPPPGLLSEASRVFVFRDVCFERPLHGEATASVKTVYGSEVPRRVRLLLMTDAASVPADDARQTLRRRCSGGGRPQRRHCSGGADGATCATLDDTCPGSSRAVTEVEVSTIVTAGTGAACFSVAVAVGEVTAAPALVGLELSARPPAAARR